MLPSGVCAATHPSKKHSNMSLIKSSCRGNSLAVAYCVSNEGMQNRKLLEFMINGSLFSNI